MPTTVSLERKEDVATRSGVIPTARGGMRTMSSARSGTRVITDRAGIATDADKIRATGIHQPAAVAELANTDDGRATLARRIKSDGLK